MSLVQEIVKKMPDINLSIKVLPSLPPNAIKFNNVMNIKCEKTSFEVFMLPNTKYLITIRHKPTIDLISKYTKNFELIGETTIEPGELFIVASLTRRTPVSGQDVQVNENDIMLLLCRNMST